MVTAILRPHLVGAVKDALDGLAVLGMTVTELHGYGREMGPRMLARGADHHADLIARVKIEVLVDDEAAAAVTDAVRRAAWTGKVGDGKVWVTPIDTVVRVRTGERGSDAV